MTSTNFTWGDALSRYLDMFTGYQSFPILAIAALIFVIIVACNLKNKNSYFLIHVLNFILIAVICYTNGSDIINYIDTFWHPGFYKNTYCYLFNMIISLILLTCFLRSKRVHLTFKYIISVFYYFILVNLLFTLTVSNYFSNLNILVVGNTYPMVYFGNILALTFYIVIIIYCLFFIKKKEKHRLGNHL